MINNTEHFFHVLIDHLYVFFWKTSLQVFCPFLNWVVCDFGGVLSFMSCLYILDTNPLSVISFTNIFSHSVDCLFILLMVSFAVQKLLSLIRSHLFIFVSVSFALHDRIRNILLWFMSKSVLPKFYVRSFILFSFTFRSLILLNLFLCSFTWSCPVFPALLVEETVFSLLYILASCVVDQLTVSVWVYFWALCSVLLICVSVFVPVPCCLCCFYCSFVV